MTDAALVGGARNGDTTACDQLVQRHQRAVLSVAWSLLGDFAEAEDIAQEAFIRAFRNLDMLADPARFGPWVRRIAFGTTIDWLRTFRPQLFRAVDDEVESRATLADPADDPLEQLERIQLRERVRDAVRRLPPRYRAPLTLFHLDGLSHERVAAALGVTTGTARSLVTRARQRLAPLLAAVHDDEAAAMKADDLFAESQMPRRILHITNGDTVASTLRESGVPGEIAVWADVLHDGPVRPDSGTSAWRAARAQFIARSGRISREEAERTYAQWDAALERAHTFDETVTWLEHDMFDQLLLIHHLERFSRAAPPPRLSLICIGEFPGIQPFHGLGQLGADQLASLLDTRQTITNRQLELGRRAWAAFTGTDPRRLAATASDAADALPFLPGAIHRLLQEFPSTVNGLPRAEQQILESLRSGPMSLLALFRACQQREERVYMGDTAFADRILEMHNAPHPLVTIEFDPARRGPLNGTAQITPHGRAVLEGADALRLNPFDRWIGGVHLTGPHPSWRWDPDRDGLAPG